MLKNISNYILTKIFFIIIILNLSSCLQSVKYYKISKFDTQNFSITEKMQFIENNNSRKNSKNYNECNGGYYKLGLPYKIFGITYTPKKVDKFVQTGLASWYGDDFHNRKTANGEKFNMYDMTAAHKTLQIPSVIKVTNLENGKSVILRVNDRGPFFGDRILDVSKAAAEKLEFHKKGLTKIKIEFLKSETEKFCKKCNINIK